VNARVEEVVAEVVVAEVVVAEEGLPVHHAAGRRWPQLPHGHRRLGKPPWLGSRQRTSLHIYGTIAKLIAQSEFPVHHVEG